MATETPKNEFRDQVVKEETASEQEMLERDQKISYLRIKCQSELLEADHLHTQRAIERLGAFGNEIFQLPNSEGRTAMLAENKQHIERLEKQLEGNRGNRVQRVLLSIFEEKFGLQDAADEMAVKKDDGPDDEPEELKD